MSFYCLRNIFGRAKRVVKIIVDMNGGRIPCILKWAYPNVSESTKIIKSSLAGAKVGKSSYIKDSRLSKEVVIGEHCKIVGATLKGKVSVGSYTALWGVDNGCIMLVSSVFSIEIGKFCSIGRNVSIYEYNHPLNRISTYYISQNILNKDMSECVESEGAVKIGNDVWVGVNAVILSGVKIGNGAVIAAGSIVTKEVPPYAIVGGVSAKVIKYRFNDVTRKYLEDLEWWDWPVERIINNENIFIKNDVTLDYIKENII